MSAYETLTLRATRRGRTPATRIHGVGLHEIVTLPLADVVAVFEGGGWIVDPDAKPVSGVITLRMPGPLTNSRPRAG